MKKSLIALAIMAVLCPMQNVLIAHTNDVVLLPAFKKVTITAGTSILLETAERIGTDQMTVGQLVQMKVKVNVFAEKRVVVTTGAHAIGRIKSISPATYNHPASLTIELVSVQAVDGQQIPLNGLEQSYTGKFSGEGTMVEPGKVITATVMNDMVIDA